MSYNNTRSGLSSEHGERFILSIGSKYTPISITIDSNTHRWRIEYIRSSDCTLGTLHNSRLIYDMDASMHIDEDIEDHMCQDGECRMSMHICNVNGVEVADCMAATHNISSWDNVNMRKHCEVKYHVNNTRECNIDRFTFECKNIGAVNGMYKCTGNTTYNSLAIRTGSWIVLIMSYTHTALYQLESSEHKTVCSRLDGRGVTNVEHLDTFGVRIQSQ